jgi:hypothetical protein
MHTAFISFLRGRVSARPIKEVAHSIVCTCQACPSSLAPDCLMCRSLKREHNLANPLAQRKLLFMRVLALQPLHVFVCQRRLPFLATVNHPVAQHHSDTA